MYSKKTKVYEPLAVDGRIKITEEIFNAIKEIRYVEEDYTSKEEFYQSIAKKYNISAGSVRNIHLIRETKDNRHKRGQNMRFTSLGLNKIITEDMTIEFVTELYKKHFKKEPTRVSARDKYGVMQVVILPEMIFFQLNEQCLTDKQIFDMITPRNFYAAVNSYHKINKERKITLQEMKDMDKNPMKNIEKEQV